MLYHEQLTQKQFMQLIPTIIILLSLALVFAGLVMFGRWAVGNEKPRNPFAKIEDVQWRMNRRKRKKK